MAYTPVSFVYGETLTSTKMNIMAANDASFHDGSGLPDLPPIPSVLDSYPVGSIYISATLDTATKVHDTLGGTWVAWGAGRVPVGVDTAQTEFDTAEKTGGNKEVTLTADQMPKHRHTNLYTAENALIGTGGSSSSVATGHISNGSYNLGSIRTGDAGGDEPHNNLQPYITCYMWKRTT